VYDPLILGEEIENMVTKGNLRKYYRRPRSEKWYGGIASAYCCGCNLKCVFCWSGFPRDNPDKIGDFYTPEEIFNGLIKVAVRFGYNQLRVTGNEPTLGRDHLFGILELVERTDFVFILETNGILIGHDRHFAEQLSNFSHLHVRVSLKATNPEEFSRLTGARQETFHLQLTALENLINAGISCNPAIMISFTTPKGLESLKDKLQTIDKILPNRLEEEHVILYPPVIKRLKKAGIEPAFSLSHFRRFSQKSIRA
jgi:uncharacterized Fe-S cluster-containing radical SAM superfamily protein